MGEPFEGNGSYCYAIEMVRFFREQRRAVVDVFRGSEMEPYARKLGFGLWVVPKAYSAVTGLNQFLRIHQYFQRLADDFGLRSTAIKGGARYYRTIQTSDGVSQCTYDYDGIGKHKVHNLSEIPPLAEADN